MMVDSNTREAIEYYYSQGWTDGLPVVPCTQELLDEFLATVDRDPDDLVIHFRGVNRSCTVRDAAINSAMAGCLPSYFPVVLAAWAAIDAEGWASLGILQSTSGSATLLVVNGPVSQEIGLNAAGNVFGSGFRANATIGRAMRLTAINVFGLKPHILDQATQGQPARYSACIAENEADSPWAPLHIDFGFDPAASTVTAMSMRSLSHIEARQTRVPEQLLLDVADTIARTGVLLHATTAACIVLSPEHANLLADQGWTKDQVRSFVIGNARIPRSRLIEVGKSAVSNRSRFRVPADHPDAVAVDDGVDSEHVAVLAQETALHVVVAGAANAGVSAVANLYGTGNELIPVVVKP